MRLIIVLVLTAFITSCSNDKKGSDRVDEKAKDNGTITDKHVQVPMSGLYIIPPAGFTPDSVTQYLQIHGDASGIQAFFYMTGLDSAKEGDTKMAAIKAESEQKYPGEWKEETITASGSHPAKLYRYKVMFDKIGYSLYFTDDFSRQMLEAMYSVGNDSLGKVMVEAMKTVVVKKDNK